MAADAGIPPGCLLDAAGPARLHSSLGRMKYQSGFSGLLPFLTLYLGIGCVIGLFEYGIAKYAFRNSCMSAISRREMLLTCVLKNAVAWPVILFWLGMLGLLKIYLLFRGRR